MTWQNPSVASRPKCCKNIGEEDSHRPLQTLGYIMHSIELILVLYPGLRPACQEAHPCPLNVLTLLLCLDFKGFIDLKEQRWQDIFSKAIVGLLHFELNKFLSGWTSTHKPLFGLVSSDRRSCSCDAPILVQQSNFLIFSLSLRFTIKLPHSMNVQENCCNQFIMV